MTMFRFLFSKENSQPYGFFTGGLNTSSTILSSSERYFFNSESVSSGAAISLPRRGNTGCGNLYHGYMRGGSDAATVYKRTDKVIFSANVAVTSTDLTTERYLPAASSISSSGIWRGGYTSSISAATEVFNFSAESNSGGPNLSQSRYASAAASSNTHAYCFGGYTGVFATSRSAVVDKYTWSNNTSSATTSLNAAALTNSPAPQNKEFAIIRCNDITDNSVVRTHKYTFSSDTDATTTALLTVVKLNFAACSNQSFGIFNGGGPTPGSGTGAVAVSEKFLFSDSSVSPGTSLSVARTEHGAMSSTPGNL